MIVNITTTQNNYFDRTETLVRYYEDIRKYLPLDIQREHELIDIYQNSRDANEKEKAKNELICANQRFVLGMARRWATNDNILDIINEANIGMVEALEEYDLKQNVKFITFAVFYIRRAINNYLIKNGKIIKRSNLAKTFHLLSQATNKFLQREERNPTNDELMTMLVEEYNVDIKDAHDVLPLRVQSIDGFDEDSEDAHGITELIEFNASSAMSNEYETNSENEFIKTVTQNVLKCLTPLEKEVITSVFGINQFREYELQEVGDRLGYTSERIRQIRNEALKKMRSFYEKQTKKL